MEVVYTPIPLYSISILDPRRVPPFRLAWLVSDGNFSLVVISGPKKSRFSGPISSNDPCNAWCSQLNHYDPRHDIQQGTSIIIVFVVGVCFSTLCPIETIFLKGYLQGEDPGHLLLFKYFSVDPLLLYVYVKRRTGKEESLPNPCH